MMPNRRLLPLVLGAALALAGCNDSTGNDRVPIGSMSFQYSGAESGSFSATGAYQRETDSTFVNQEFAVGVRGISAGQSASIVSGYEPTGASTGDMLFLAFETPRGPSTLTINDQQCGDEELCPFGLLMFDLVPGAPTGSGDPVVYTLDSGTIQVTSISSRRMQGTFSGTATTFFGEDTVHITNGTFDVPVVQESFIGARMQRIGLRLDARK